MYVGGIYTSSTYGTIIWFADATHISVRTGSTKPYKAWTGAAWADVDLVDIRVFAWV
jgi:hypothetical protein